MSTDPLPKIGPKTTDPLFFIRPQTPEEEAIMQEALSECDRIMGVSNEQGKQGENELEHNEKQHVSEPRGRWVGTKDLAKYLGNVPMPTIRDWIKLGKLKPHRTPGIRSLRFNLDEIDAMWKNGEKEKPVDNQT